MITTDQLVYIEEHAYVPEHIIPYVIAVSQTEPFLFGDFLTYAKEGNLIFIGYPLKEDFEEKMMTRALGEATRRLKPREIAITAPALPSSWTGCPPLPSDHYYRLDLGTLSIPQKTRNMISRAKRELVAERSQAVERDHRELIDQFLHSRSVDEATRFIFERIPQYVSSSNTAWVFSVRNRRGHLVAFDVAEFGSNHYAFYMFNFSSRAHYVPGASDLLLHEVIQFAKIEQKGYINLGLGINPGVAFYKRKWGGVPFLPYTFSMYHPQREAILEALLRKL
jgi:hypothetical protein